MAAQRAAGRRSVTLSLCHRTHTHPGSIRSAPRDCCTCPLTAPPAAAGRSKRLQSSRLPPRGPHLWKQKCNMVADTASSPPAFISTDTESTSQMVNQTEVENT
ncbi:hypothetical protein AGIG_G13039 [Arapaima gigas]